MRCSYFNCLVCNTSSLDCVSCKDLTRTVESSCFDCSDEYYESQKVCLPCNISCGRCTNATQCSSCNVTWNRINFPEQSCPCLDGYFDQSTPVCLMCSNKCLRCINTSTTCLECAGGNRLNFPLCDCADYFYDDLSSADCLNCKDPCLKCNISGCISCKGNTYLDGQECKCPNLGFPSDMDPNYCYSCLDVLVKI